MAAGRFRLRLPAALLIATVLACLALHGVTRSRGDAEDDPALPLTADSFGDPARRAPARISPRGIPPTPRHDSLPTHVPGEMRWTLVLEVRDAEGRPVPEALVVAYAADDTEVSRRVTALDGVVELPVDDAAVVTVSHPQFALFVAAVRSLGASEGRATVSLAPGGVISGVVRLMHEEIPAVPVCVVARPARGERFDDTESRRAGAGDVRVRTTLTDSAGAFEISGVPLETDMTVLAAGPGLMQVGGPTIVRAGEGLRTILVAPVFALEVLLTDEATGRPLRAMTWLQPFSGHWPSFRRPNDVIDVFPRTYSTLDWTGIDRPAWGDGEVRTFMAFAIDSAEERHGPISMRASAPGYESRVVEVWAPRALPGAELRQAVALRRVCSGFGTVRVVTRGASERLLALMAAIESRTGENGPSLSLHYSQERPSLGIDLRAMGRGPVVVENVPAGTYWARVSIPLGWRPLCDRVYEFDLPIGGVVELVVDLEGCPIVHLQPRHESGEDWTGALQVLARRLPGNIGSAWSFDGPPYSVIGLEPGSYEVQAVGALASNPSPMVVEAGGESEARITVRPPRPR